jgi:tetraacyldisaccharide 4'-kinase
MKHPPGWWQVDGTLARLLTPAGWLTAAYTARRVARPGFRAGVPVLCCGNATVGGSGKTPLAIDLLTRLRARGIDAHALLRGHGGSIRATHRVTAAETAARVGDEALLLARVAPCWIGPDRGAGARAAIAAGAAALVMDDGLQNPSLVKDCAFLVIDGGQGFGNGRVLPAGPLREPVAAAAARCAAAVLIGADRTGALGALPPALPVLRAEMVPDAAMRALAGQRVFAFAGIGRPAKFYASLESCGAVIAGRRDFPDHHPYSDADLRALRAVAGEAMLVTTPKDAVRLPSSAGAIAAGISLAWEDPAAIEFLLTRQMSQKCR